AIANAAEARTAFMRPAGIPTSPPAHWTPPALPRTAGRARARTATCALPVLSVRAQAAGSPFTRFEHIDDTLAAAHIDMAALAIDKHIIGITAGLDLGHDMPVLAGERHQCRGVAEDKRGPGAHHHRSPWGNSIRHRVSAMIWSILSQGRQRQFHARPAH